jgi:hypothetical protein
MKIYIAVCETTYYFIYKNLYFYYFIFYSLIKIDKN